MVPDGYAEDKGAAGAGDGILFPLLKAELLVWEQLELPLEGLVELGYFPTEELVIV